MVLMVPRCGASMGGAGFWAPLLVLLQLAAAAAGPPKTIMTILIGARSVSLPALPFADCQCRPEPDSATARRMPATRRRTPDDLGFADTQLNNPFSPTPHIGELAYSGVKLLQYHAYMYCSPTRRSILSGRFPIHLGTEQAPVCSNFLPLQMTLLPAKLKQAGYTGHFIGKGHLGYQTTDQCVVIPCAAALPPRLEACCPPCQTHQRDSQPDSP